MLKGLGTYIRWDVTSQGEMAHVRFETNDGNDDGYPDGNVSVDEFEVTLKAALNIAGTSHTGCWGQPVNVYLDRRKI